MKPDILRVRPRSVVFTDGSEVECDHIVANIGYRPALPYLEASMGKWLNPVRTPCGGGVDPRRLYKNVFHPDMEGRMVRKEGRTSRRAHRRRRNREKN